MPGPELSVVIVAWRSREDVLASLGSLAAHGDIEHEVIVVDDGSDDGTAQAVAERFPEVNVIAKPVNEGLVAGRNTALEHVRGRLVLMLDADTQIRPAALSAMAEVLDRDPAVGIVGPKLVYPSGEIQLSCRRYPPLLMPLLRRGPYARLHPDPLPHRWHLMKDFDHDHERPVVWVAGAAQMWRASLPALIGTYDTRISSYGGEDQDWCMRAWRAGLEVRYAPQAEVVHVFQQMTRRRLYGRKSIRALRDFYYLQWKHRALRNSPALAAANA